MEKEKPAARSPGEDQEWPRNERTSPQQRSPSSFGPDLLTRTWDKVENWLKKDMSPPRLAPEPIPRNSPSSSSKPPRRSRAFSLTRRPIDINTHISSNANTNTNTNTNDTAASTSTSAQPLSTSVFSPHRGLFTFLQRRDSERRDRLYVHRPDASERRAVSADRRAIGDYMALQNRGLGPIASQSVPDVSTLGTLGTDGQRGDIDGTQQQQQQQQEQYVGESMGLFHDAEKGVEDVRSVEIVETDRILDLDMDVASVSVSMTSFEDEERLAAQAEMESKWIVNLSMFFKDRSDREKFFVTYAQRPNKMRRLTVSCDYRNAQPESLEADLKAMLYQRDKSARVYEALRQSLPDIQFYPTVTNLKLKTIDGQLHIHCSEDVNEIIRYPYLQTLSHIAGPIYKEADVSFVSHLSGFVYRVNVCGNILVKKEIPGPDSVDEFIYEVNALNTLKNRPNIIQFHGLVVGDEDNTVKGLLINYASRGALIETIYDAQCSDQDIPWCRRERWARQIVNGLAEIHESGYVQGDFTLSNIVIHEDDSISLIDINRRGCPMGWEPPELMPMIDSGQRISMFIGTKTDLFQLGMVLWAIAMMVDEPNREQRPLREINRAEVPQYYHDIVDSCLRSDPRGRLGAKYLLQQFPPSIDEGASEFGLDGVTYFDDPVPSTAVSTPSIMQDESRFLRSGIMHDDGLGGDKSLGSTTFLLPPLASPIDSDVGSLTPRASNQLNKAGLMDSVHSPVQEN